jgi:threonine/homoserine/homoserine lactone efflux protein
MTLASYLTYVSALAITADIPGQDVTAFIVRTLGSGFHLALFMALGYLTYLTATVFGLAMLTRPFLS